MVRIGKVFVRAQDVKAVDTERNVALGYSGETWSFDEDEAEWIVVAVEKSEREFPGLGVARIRTVKD